MKQFFTLLIMLGLSNQLIAQSEQQQTRQLEVGVNATAFITNIFRGSTNNAYLLMLKKKMKNGKTLRLGGGIYGNFLTEDPSGPDLQNGSTISNFDFDIRAGLEKDFLIKNNWSLKIGMDVISGYSLNKYKVNFGKRTIDSYYIGIGPVAGIQYMINSRMGLLTETSANIRMNEFSYKDKYDDPVNDENYKRTYLNLGMILPTDVFFFFRF